MYKRQVINKFTVDSTNGSFVNTTLTIMWNVTHTTNFPMVCTLRVNGVNMTVPCIGTEVIDPYTQIGTGMFEIFAIDNQSIEVTEKISQKFKLPDTPLNNLGLTLIVDKYTIKGEFDFEIKVENEDSLRRELFVRPVIVCDGIENNLRSLPSGTLDHSAVSHVDAKTSVYTFQSDTLDYELVVPTAKDCEFHVYVTDIYGDTVLLTAPICFVYEEETQRISSIRGQGTDIINYMHTTLGGIERGYNTIDFSVDNREASGKEMEISVISRELGISYTTNENWDSDEVRPLSIPLYVDPRFKDGMYPVRISVFDGADKQVRYSYIKLETEE